MEQSLFLKSPMKTVVTKTGVMARLMVAGSRWRGLRGLLLAALVGPLLLGLGGCSPERRSIIKLSATNFRDQAIRAITQVQGIYELRSPSRAPQEARARLGDRLLRDGSLYLGDVRRLDQVIRTGLNLANAPEEDDLQLALQDLEAEYVLAGQAFENLQSGGIFASKAVQDAAQPARRLTVKMVLLADLIRQSPPTPRDPERVLIAVQLNALQTRFRAANISESERQLLRNKVDTLVSNWLALQQQEQDQLCRASAQLLVAAQTGTQLSQLLDQYNRLSLDELLGGLDRVFSTATLLSGRDFGQVTSQLGAIDGVIKRDPTLNQILNGLPQEIWRNARTGATGAPQALPCGTVVPR